MVKEIKMLELLKKTMKMIVNKMSEMFKMIINKKTKILKEMMVHMKIDNKIFRMILRRRC
jgi:hypothetical protein